MSGVIYGTLVMSIEGINSYNGDGVCPEYRHVNGLVWCSDEASYVTRAVYILNIQK